MAWLIFEIVVWSLAFAGVVLLFLHQCRVQVCEWRFYRARGWDMSEDSGLDREDVPSAIRGYQTFAPKARFQVIRPLFLVILVVFMGVMAANWF
jgi:hypothetical protein